MTLREITKQYLEKHGYDGLYGDECGCKINDLMPCGEPYYDCEPGYVIDCNACEYACKYNYCIGEK